MSDQPDFEPDFEPGFESPDQPLPTGRSRRGYLTPRQTFQAIAIALIVALVALLIYLLFFMQLGNGLVSRGGADHSGIRPLFTISGPGIGKFPRFERPMGAAFGIDGRIYVADTGHNRICAFSSSGTFLFEFGAFGTTKPIPGVRTIWQPGMLNYPVGIAIDSDGTIYVADFRNDQIQAFAPDGRPLRSFPDPNVATGRGSSGQFNRGIAVTDVAVRGGKVYATDTFQVFVFDLGGRLLRQFGKPGLGTTDLDHPNGIAVGSDGTVFVSDSNHARLLALRPDGGLLWSLGKIPRGGKETTKSVFTLPRGIATSDDGSLLVIDAFDFDVSRVSSDGKLLHSYGERGVEPGQLNYPNDVDVSGKRVLLTDKENGRVQIVELLDK